MTFDGPQTLRISELILVGLAMALIAISVVFQFLYQDAFFTERVAKEDAIAEVVASTSDTRRRAPDNFEFLKIKPQSRLANGDYVYSGDGSQVTLKFVNGTRILIGEQSLVMIREINGTPDLLIERGAISGAFEDESEVEIKTRKETVVLNGEKNAQFYVTYLQGGGLEIGSIDRRVRIESNGEKADLVKSKVRVSKDTGIKTVDMGDQGPAPEAKNAPDKTLTGTPSLPPGMDLTDEESKERITLTPPHPKTGLIILHSNGGRVPIFPKLQCQGPCEIRLSVNGKPAVSKKFERDMVPFLFLSVQPGIEATVNWEFSDGTELFKGSFDVLENNEASFQRALEANRPVEVLN